MDLKTDELADNAIGNDLISNAPNTHSDGSFSLSMVDQLFNQVQNQEVHNDSSLSLIDLETVDDNEIFMRNKNPSITPVLNFRLQPLMEEELSASPIPASGNVCLRVTNTPETNLKGSSLCFSKPRNQHPYSKSVFSSIPGDAIVASTPFHRRSRSSLEEKNDRTDDVFASSIVNRTYNLNDPVEESNPATTQRPCDATYDGNRRVISTTFTAPRNPINDATFNKTAADFSRVAPSNQTFEIAVDRVPEKGPTHSSRSPNEHPPTDAVCAGEPASPSAASREAIPDPTPSNQTQKKKTNILRKPSTLGSNTSTSRLKPPASSQPHKQVSRLQPPKALKNPSKTTTSSKSARASQDKEVAPPPKPVNQSISKPKPTNTTSRRSLLPPASSKLRTTPAPAKKAILARFSLGSQSNLKPTSTPRNTSKPSNVAGTCFKKSAPSSGLRSNVTSSSSKPSVMKSSKIQSQFKSSCRKSVSSTSNLANSCSKRETNKSRVCTSKPGADSSPKRRPRSSRCAVAMCVLLDYVVNKIDGLSAPKLLSQKENLQMLLEEKTQSNAELASRVDQLQSSLDEAISSRDRDVAEALKRNQEELKRLSENYQSDLKKLSEELQNMNRKFSEKERCYDNNLRTIKNKHNVKLHEITLKYEDEISSLNRKWAEERQELNNVALKLHQEMDASVEERVQELIGPYTASHEENKSLRAVLDMRNDEQQKLMLELSHRDERIDEARALQDHVTVLLQRNEDLKSQIDHRILQQKKAQTNADALRRQLSEQQSANQLLTQRVEELSYRLHTSSPSSPSPFNPVFTPSPSALTPNGCDFNQLATPLKSRSSDSHDVTASSPVNGCG